MQILELTFVCPYTEAGVAHSTLVAAALRQWMKCAFLVWQAERLALGNGWCALQFKGPEEYVELRRNIGKERKDKYS